MKTIKFTPAKLAGLKHPTGTRPEKWFDAGCEGLAIFVQPEPSLKKSYYAHWSKATIGKDGKKKTSGRYKYLGRFGGVKNLEAIKAHVVVNLPIWKAGNITTNSVKTVRSLRAEYKNAGAATGFRVKAKGTKIKYKKKTSDGYMGLLDTYVLANTVKESTKNLLTAPFKQGDNSYYKKQLADIPLDKLTKRDIEIWHNRMESIPTAANRALAALSVLFEWDSKRSVPSYKGFNPCLRIAKYQEQKDKRFIDSIEKVIEVSKILEEQQWRDPHFNTFYRLQLEYGERLADSYGITWKKPVSLVDQKKCTGWIDWRKKNAEDRWGIKPVPAACSSISEQHDNRSSRWIPPTRAYDDAPTVTKKRKYSYYGESLDAAVQVAYIAPYEPKELIYKAKVITSNGKLKFKNKLEEAIYNHPNYSKQKF